MSTEVFSCIRSMSLHSVMAQAGGLMPAFRDGMNPVWAGFTPVGYTTPVPKSLTDHLKRSNLMGKMRFNLFTGALIGVGVKGRWASLRLNDGCWPYQAGKVVQKQVDSGTMKISSWEWSW